VTLRGPDQEQLRRVRDLARGELGDDLLGLALYGSAVTSGLRPSSDLDLFAVTARPTGDAAKRRLIDGLLPISGSRATAGPARSIELTMVVQSAVRPWRYPPAMDFQYGDWLRGDFERGDLRPGHDPNPDLAILLTAVLQASRPLDGQPIDELLDPVPREDLVRAMLDELPGLLEDLEGDTRNVVLTLARIWTTLETGELRSKDRAADWALVRLPPHHQHVLAMAKSAYLDEAAEAWNEILPDTRAFAAFVEREIRSTSTTYSG